MRISLPIFAAMALLLSLLASPPASAATELRPNLQALPAQDISLVTTNGQRLLRFSTITANIGAGPLELRGGPITGSQQRVVQRVYDSAGGYVDYQAGDFIFHPAHNHIHFENYALYELQPVDAPGGSLRTGSKITFCVLDTTRINTKLPGAPRKAFYSVCGNQIQGLSVGWGDKYHSGLAGQSIDTTGLPDGVYDIRITVDPQNRLLETNEGDNVSVRSIRLTGNTVTILDARR